MSQTSTPASAHAGDIHPFQAQAPESELEDLRDRLRRTRWTDDPDGLGWSLGTDETYLRGLVDYWLSRFDWRAVEARFNEFPQFLTEIDGEQVHFVHVTSPEPDAVPLVLLHGWPGTFADFLDVIGPLSDPRSHGGDPSDAFHVVVPSLPGSGYSGPTKHLGVGGAAMANIVRTLLQRLGYERYFVQGGDVGSMVASYLAAGYPDEVRGVHLNVLMSFPTNPADPFDGLSGKDLERARRFIRFQTRESAYFAVQSQTPQTLSYGLADSPVGLAGWLVEKYRAWSGAKGDIEGTFSLDHLLTHITLYWITQTIGSSMRFYVESGHPDKAALPPTVNAPTAYAAFADDNYPSPRPWGEAAYPNLVRWTDFPAGGHFASQEQPVAFVDDVRTFVRDHRA